MRIWRQDQIQSPRIVHNGLQASNALEFDFVKLLFIRIVFAYLQHDDDLIDAIFAEILHPTQRIAGQGHAQALEAGMDFRCTVLFAQVADEVLRLLESGIAAMLQRRFSYLFGKQRDD